MTEVHCPNCGEPLSETALREAAKILGARAKPGPGRRKSDKPRCPCGKNTMRRAEAHSWRCCKAAGLTVPPKTPKSE
jgi:ribosomal protein L37AE/L43A